MYRYSIQWKINIFKSFCFSLASSNFKSAPAPAKTPRLRPAPQHWYFLYLLRKCFENSRLELAPIIFLLPGTVYPAPQDWLLETTISVLELLKDKKTKLKISLINKEKVHSTIWNFLSVSVICAAAGEWGSVRLRTRFLQDLIMPLDEYSPLKELVLNPRLEVVCTLADICHQDRLALATSLLRIFRSLIFYYYYWDNQG